MNYLWDRDLKRLQMTGSESISFKGNKYDNKKCIIKNFQI